MSDAEYISLKQHFDELRQSDKDGIDRRFAEIFERFVQSEKAVASALVSASNKYLGYKYMYTDGAIDRGSWDTYAAAGSGTVRFVMSETSDFIYTRVQHKLRAGAAGAGTAPLLFQSGTLNTTPVTGSMEFLTDDLYFTITTGTKQHKIARVITATATLDFPSTLAGASSDLTITVTGAVVGDSVAIGVPDGSTLANGNFTAWVSAADTVKIRFANNSLTLALDPASGTFKATVIKN